MIGLGTTGGWRHADLTLARELRARQVDFLGYWPDLSRVQRLRNVARPLSMEYTDAYAIRRLLLRHVVPEPDLVVVSSGTATLLLPRRWSKRVLLWSDTPIRLARTGRGTRLLALAERRAMSRVGAVGVQPRESVDLYRTMFPKIASRIGPLAVPVSLPERVSQSRERLGVMYAGNPDKKGLDLAVAGWIASETDARLVITGIAPQAARDFLASRSVPIPSNIEFAGRVSAPSHREMTRRAAVFVSTSRREEYGNSQVEALADGAILVSGPCRGTAEPRALARRVDETFVTSGGPAELGPMIRRAIDLPNAQRESYQQTAHRLLRLYTSEQLSRDLAVLTDAMGVSL